MLKIKDNIDLKELEKFGFKPQYDEDTGELVEMYRIREITFNNEIQRIKTTTITRKEYARQQLKSWGILKNFWYILKRNRIIKPNIYELNLDVKDYEILYDLIQAGLVEKV